GLLDMVETEYIKEEEPLVLLHLQTDEKLPGKNTVNSGKITVGKMLTPDVKEGIYSSSESTPISLSEPRTLSTDSTTQVSKDSTSTSSPMPAAPGGYQLARPSNIYAEPGTEADASTPS